MKTISGIIFDIDGVIVDTENLHLKAFQSVLRKHATYLTEAGYEKWFSGKSISGGFQSFQAENKINLSAEQFAREKIDATKDAFRTSLTFFDDTLEFVQQIEQGNRELRGIGFLKPEPILALTTGLALELLTILLEKKPEFKNIFPVIIMPDDYKSSKPDPECYLKTLEAMRLQPEEVIGIEDSIPGVQSLNAADIFSVAVTKTHAKEELQEADLIMDSLIELLVE